MQNRFLFEFFTEGNPRNDLKKNLEICTEVTKMRKKSYSIQLKIFTSHFLLHSA